MDKLKIPQEYFLNPPRSLDDIGVSDIYDYPPLDKGILNLVKACRGIGLITMGSCEGHLNDRNRHNHPWVTCNGLWHYLEMYGLLLRYNHRRRIKWMIENVTLKPVVSPVNKEDLKKQQEGANELAEFLFREFYKYNNQRITTL